MGMNKPLIFAACDSKYHEKYAKSLKASAEEHGMKCKIVCGGDISREQAMVLRFKLLPDVMAAHPHVLVLDIDSIINEPIYFHERWDMGIFLRDELGDLQKNVLAAAFYVKDTAFEFVDELASRLSGPDIEWFSDQYVIWKLYLKYKDKYKIKRLGPDLIYWREHHTSIWTAKGNAKESEWFIRAQSKYA